MGNRVFVLILCLAAGINAAWATGRVAVVTVPVAVHDLRETLTLYGKLQPDPDHVNTITLPRAGLVTSLSVRLGQRVKAGDPLLELDTAPTARMDFAQAQAAVDFARNNVSRLRKLLDEQLATKEQVAGAERDLRDAEARLQAQRRLGTNVGHETVRAPFTGVVTKIDVSQGQRVQADSVALLLASGDAMVALLGLEPEDVPYVHAGMPVRLTAVLQPDLEIQSEVADVHAMVDPSTRLVDLLVRLPAGVSPAPVLNSTMQGVVTVRQARTLAVPRSAVLRDDKGAYIFVVKDARARRVDVKTGLEQDGLIGVAGDLAAGDAVVTVGNYELNDGDKVREAGR
jgi:RND family efflux transporter MFP subunit